MISVRGRVGQTFSSPRFRCDIRTASTRAPCLGRGKLHVLKGPDAVYGRNLGDCVRTTVEPVALRRPKQSAGSPAHCDFRLSTFLGRSAIRAARWRPGLCENLKLRWGRGMRGYVLLPPSCMQEQILGIIALIWSFSVPFWHVSDLFTLVGRRQLIGRMPVLISLRLFTALLPTTI